MTVYALGAQADDAIAAVGEARGGPALSTGARLNLVPWTPASHPPMAGPDTLMLLQPTDEAQVLAEGGRLHNAYQTYYAVTRAALSTGPFVAKAFPEDATGIIHATYPLTGALPLDEWTIELWAKSKALDFRSQSVSAVLLSIYDTNGDSLRLVGTPGNGQCAARFHIGGTPRPDAIATLSIADWPAATWRSRSGAISCGGRATSCWSGSRWSFGFSKSA